jgi:hypothetical protein
MEERVKRAAEGDRPDDLEDILNDILKGRQDEGGSIELCGATAQTLD